MYIYIIGTTRFWKFWAPQSKIASYGPEFKLRTLKSVFFLSPSLLTMFPFLTTP